MHCIKMTLNSMKLCRKNQFYYVLLFMTLLSVVVMHNLTKC